MACLFYLHHQILFQYLRDKKKKRKKGAQKKGGENSPISPPLDPRLGWAVLELTGTLRLQSWVFDLFLVPRTQRIEKFKACILAY